ncbi:hypothetical protein BDP27DRAFT_1319955 [Rhodocollybia butyracea]|uniref:F-box domain-containing protein n=1 Tax=Rhodocollybia butyracea TaxID=206335 RepID=A0A9P5Q0F2_9AGAR|nr:hypothetical protein BDP27DRAFT_1319955 [Rhodocollybia butyracea]
MHDYALDITINSARAWTLDLSQVCSVWRQIIRSRPSLWSSLWIDLSHRHRAFEVMKHYLKRSQRAPLTLFIAAGSLDQESMEDDDMAKSVSSAVEDTYEDLPLQLRDYSWEVLELLFSVSERWKDVTMRLSWHTFTEISQKFDFRDTDFNQVVALNLDWRYREIPRLGHFMLSSAHLPSLRRLVLTEFGPWFNLPLHCITTLGPMRYWKSSAIVHALAECRNVDSFTISLIDEPFDWELSPPILINARSLDITGENNNIQLAKFADECTLAEKFAKLYISLAVSLTNAHTTL